MTPDTRHLRRRGALLALYQYDAGRGDEPETIRAGLAAADVPDELLDEAMTLATSAWEARAETDEAIAKLAPLWPPNRQPAMDRAILRLGMWELRQGTLPAAVAIDEAVELAHEFGTDRTSSFINGVLDAYRDSLTGAAREVDPSDDPGDACTAGDV